MEINFLGRYLLENFGGRFDKLVAFANASVDRFVEIRATAVQAVELLKEELQNAGHSA